MKTTAIIADSTCDLSAELLEKYDITLFPLHIHLGDKEYSDGVNITPEEIYEWSDKNKATPKTSAISPFEAQVYLQKALADAKEVIAFCISEDMSACANVMRMAAAELQVEDRVYVINSENLSTGIGLQIIEAAIMAQQGIPAKEIVVSIQAMRPFVRASFVVDTLTYLYRGGRCSGVAALAGGALKLHPRIVVVDGAMKPEKKYRGKMASVILNYAKDMEEQLLSAKKDRVFITHSGCDEEVIESVKAYLESLKIFDEILVTRAGGVISSHCGAGTLGVLFIAGE